MSILSFEFIFFFALVIISYYLVPIRWRWVHLLLSSIFFYGLISLPYLFLVIILTVIDFFIAKGFVLEKFKNRKKILLISGLGANILILFFFKALNPIYTGLVRLLHSPDLKTVSPLFNLILPLGISYYIFKKLSYLIDTYRGKHSPERNYAKLLLYVIFFPEITAGPIDRAGTLIPQFGSTRDFDRQQILRGIQLILWGMFKKLIIADRLAGLVNPIFNQPDHFGAGYLALATLGFSIQIYCDFSGYTDMAIGIGHTLGYSLTDNFDRPYFSRSIVEFWKRWHISLSKWLQDYLFLPLAYYASRKLKSETVFKIKSDLLAYGFGVIVTMSLCGLWHGFSFTFLFWGFLHGFFLALSFFTRKPRRKIRKFLKLKQFPVLDRFIQTSLTFSLVSFAWIFFRANSLSEGFEIVGRIFLGSGAGRDSSRLLTLSSTGFSPIDFLIATVAILFLLLIEWFLPIVKFGKRIRTAPIWQRWLIYYAVIFIILFFGVFESDIFIYEGF